MKAAHTLLQAIVAVTLLATLFITVPAARAAGGTITVTGTGDDLVVGNLGGNGICELREAVEVVNQNLVPEGNDCSSGSTTPGDVDTIAFNLSGGTTINLAATLVVSQPVIIDGTTLTSYGGIPLVTLTGTSDPLMAIGSTAPGSTIKALQLTNTGTSSTALSLESSGSTVTASYFNTNGTASTGNSATGISVSADDNTIGGPNDADRNLFGGLIGVYVSGASGNTVQNNYFGTTSTGNAALTGVPGYLLGVGSAGVQIDGGYGESAANTVRDNVVTGSSYGILLISDDLGQTHDTVIAGNHIGLGQDGTTRLANGLGVVLRGSAGNALGGPSDADRNVISGNQYGQVLISSWAGATPDSNTIQGNYIGLTGNGSAALVASPTMDGIALQGGTGNIVGGTAAGSANVISGNYNGIVIDGASDTSVRGNHIGTDPTGLTAIPNTQGLQISTSANIGDSTTPGNNVVSGNSGAAIDIVSGAVTVVGNRIGVDAAGNALGNGSGLALHTGASAQVVRNWIGHNTGDAVFIPSGAAITGDATGNCFTANSAYAVDNTSGTAVSFPRNWWNAADGPGGQGAGSGDAVSDFVTYDPFYLAPAAACGPGLGADPSPLAFGKQLVGTTSPAQTITFSNNGIADLTLSAFSVEAPYSLVGTSPCLAALPLILHPGEYCTVDVQFSPTASGVVPPHNITVTSDAASSPDLIPLTGTGAVGTALLKNGSFELDNNADLKPDNFIYKNFNTQSDKRDCSVRKAGACSLKLRGNGLFKSGTQTILKSGGAGDDFRFVLWSKANFVPTGAVYRLKVVFYNGKTVLGTYNLNFTPGTHGFEKVSGGFTAPGPYTKVVYKIVYDAGSGTVWFDGGLLNWAP